MTTMKARGLRVWRGIVFRPVATAWVAGGLLGAASTQEWIPASTAILVWVILGFLLLWAANHREVAFIGIEVKKVHVLVNSQHDELVATVGTLSERIIELVKALHVAGVEVPGGTAKSEVRSDGSEE